VGGLYGLNSCASSFPHPNKIFIEQVWEIDAENRFIKQIAYSKGMLIVENKIQSIQFYQF
jgi:hypothetical protein